MRRVDGWFSAQADIKRWELAAWYALILAAVAFPDWWAVGFFAFMATVLVVLGWTRWDRCECGLPRGHDDWWGE